MPEEVQSAFIADRIIAARGLDPQLELVTKSRVKNVLKALHKVGKKEGVETGAFKIPGLCKLELREYKAPKAHCRTKADGEIQSVGEGQPIKRRKIKATVCRRIKKEVDAMTEDIDIEESSDDGADIPQTESESSDDSD